MLVLPALPSMGVHQLLRIQLVCIAWTMLVRPVGFVTSTNEEDGEYGPAAMAANLTELGTQKLPHYCKWGEKEFALSDMGDLDSLQDRQYNLSVQHMVQCQPT